MLDTLSKGNISRSANKQPLNTSQLSAGLELQFSFVFTFVWLQDILDEAEATVRKRAWNSHFSGGLGHHHNTVSI